MQMQPWSASVVDCVTNDVQPGGKERACVVRTLRNDKSQNLSECWTQRNQPGPAPPAGRTRDNSCRERPCACQSGWVESSVGVWVERGHVLVLCQCLLLTGCCGPLTLITSLAGQPGHRRTKLLTRPSLAASSTRHDVWVQGTVVGGWRWRRRWGTCARKEGSDFVVRRAYHSPCQPEIRSESLRRQGARARCHRSIRTIVQRTTACIPLRHILIGVQVWGADWATYGREWAGWVCCAR